MIGYIFYVSFGVGFSRGINRYMEELQNNFTLYDWKQTPVSDAQLRATFIWDSLQSRQQCCGASGPLDWTRTRPTELGQHLYPQSCCPAPDESQQGNKYCSDNPALYKVGCIERIDWQRRIVTAYYLFAAALQLLLALVTTDLVPDGADELSDPAMIQLSWRRTHDFKTTA